MKSAHYYSVVLLIVSLFIGSAFVFADTSTPPEIPEEEPEDIIQEENHENEDPESLDDPEDFTEENQVQNENEEENATTTSEELEAKDTSTTTPEDLADSIASSTDDFVSTSTDVATSSLTDEISAATSSLDSIDLIATATAPVGDLDATTTSDMIAIEDEDGDIVVETAAEIAENERLGDQDARKGNHDLVEALFLTQSNVSQSRTATLPAVTMNTEGCYFAHAVTLSENDDEEHVALTIDRALDASFELTTGTPPQGITIELHSDASISGASFDVIISRALGSQTGSFSVPFSVVSGDVIGSCQLVIDAR